MRSLNFRRWALSTVAGLALGATAAAQGPVPIFTKNTALRLPVQLDERARAEVAEVKLFVRGPAGRWECAQTAPPTQTAFDFKAPADGEYWFTFVTVDRRGNATPASVETVAPHRKVIVDATPPDVIAQPIPLNGEKALQCQVRDANPDWSTLRVVYLAPDSTWKPLTVAAADTPTVFRIPNPSVLESKIQVTVMDRAGNRTTREIDLGDPTMPLGLPGKATLDRGRPDPALFPRDERTEAIPPIRSVEKPAGAELPKAPKAEPLDLPALPDIPNIKGDVGPEIKLPPDLKIPDPPSMKFPDPPAVRIPDVPPPGKSGEDPYRIPDLPGIKPPMDVIAPPVVPAKATSTLKPADTGLADVPPPATPVATGSHPILSTRTCTVNYQVDGPARLSTRIDFWGSPDGGRTWVPLKDAAGGNPPAKLTLPGDGIWGIRIRPGGGSRPPESLEDPDCVVEIDTVKPVVSLVPPTVAAEDGMMVIGWTASDKNLLGNSINLYYATKTEGPWEVIVSGYKNDGVYRWALPTTLSGPIYLRAEASDKAGNVGQCDLPTPIALESGKQRVRIIGVGPAK